MAVNLVMALSAFVVAGVVVEVALWVFFRTPYHEWMEWVPDGHTKGRGRPGTSFQTASGSEVNINELGFRGPTPEWVAAPGVLRLVVFGGSSTFNYHAEGEANTWPQRLQHHLSEGLGQPVEVVNLGLPGYSTVDSKINYLVNGRELNPHVVVLYHTWNDMKSFRRRENGPTVRFAGVAHNKPQWQEVARRSQIARLVRNALLLRRRQENENYYSSMEEVGERAHSMPDDVAFQWAARNYADFVRFARWDSVLPVLVSQATIAAEENLDSLGFRIAIGNRGLGMTLPVVAQTFARMARILDSVATVEGGVYVDGYSALPHSFDYLRDHVHLTDRGTDALGRTIAQTLLADEEFRRLAESIAGSTASIAKR